MMGRWTKTRAREVMGGGSLWAWLFVLASVAGAQEDSTTAVAVLNLDSVPSGMAVWIDGREVGVTPLTDFLLLPGEHELVVRSHQPASWLDTDWRERVTVGAGDTLTRLARILRGCVISSRPFGAQVRLAGKELGTTPYVLRLPAGTAEAVELVLPGYMPAYLDIMPLDEGAGAAGRHYEATLVPDRDQALTYEKEMRNRRLRLGRFRRIAYVTAGLSLASGVAAVLLKDEADEAYQQYLREGDPARREERYDRAARYDRYYGIAFTASEVCFGLAFYSFLKSIKRD